MHDDDAFSLAIFYTIWTRDLGTVVCFVVTGEIQSPVSPAPVESSQEKKGPPLQPSVVPPTVLALPIKEGMVEKKGHSAAFLMWPK